MHDADLVFTGGSVFTAGLPTSRVAGLAVRDRAIVAIGPDDELMAFRGPRTQIVDLAGGLLIPGFQDAHVHPLDGGLERLLCEVSAYPDADTALAAIAAYGDANPDAPWILGGGWQKGWFADGNGPRELLDRVIPDRPVMLTSADHHGAWVNTRALELAGVTAATPDPVDGRIEREADGYPAGTLHEGAARLVQAIVPQHGGDLMLAGLLESQRHLLSFGITGWQDALVGSLVHTADPVGIYVDAVRRGLLIARATLSLWWERSEGEEQIAALSAHRDRVAALASDRVDAGTVKIMVDGVAENFTAAMTLPYLDECGHPTGNAGISFIAREALARYVVALDRVGFQVHFHALGDRAVRDALDAVAAARLENGVSHNRHHLAHLQVVDDADIARFADLGAVANMQTFWAAREPHIEQLVLPFLESRLIEGHFPFGRLHAAGARLAAGSDWPVTTPDPIAAIHVAVNREIPVGGNGMLGDDAQKLDLATAVSAYTAGSAYVNRFDHRTGHLRVGYDADFAVLDRDPFTGPVRDIHTASVSQTWVGGVRVYDAADPSPSTPQSPLSPPASLNAERMNP